jgi:hypothetical protein
MTIGTTILATRTTSPILGTMSLTTGITNLSTACFRKTLSAMLLELEQDLDEVPYGERLPRLDHP